MAAHDDSFKIHQPLKLISLDHPHVFDAVDDGLTVSGGKYVSKQRRLQLEQALSERVIVDGRSMPRWMLAEAPTIAPRTHAVPFEMDPFYVDVLKDKRGEWFLPDAAWFAERKKRCDALAERQNMYAARADDKERAELLRKRQREAQLLQAGPAASTPSTVAAPSVNGSAAPSPGDSPKKKG